MNIRTIPHGSIRAVVLASVAGLLFTAWGTASGAERGRFAAAQSRPTPTLGLDGAMTKVDFCTRLMAAVAVDATFDKNGDLVTGGP